MTQTQQHQQRPSMRPDIEMLFDLLLAESWLAKCDVIGRQLPLAPQVRDLLRQEANEALKRGATDDAWLYAAHSSLIEDIERRGVAAVQAEILRVVTCDHLDRAAQLMRPARGRGA